MSFFLFGIWNFMMTCTKHSMSPFNLETNFLKFWGKYPALFFSLLLSLYSFLKEQFKVHSKIEVKVQRFPMYTWPPYMHRLPHYWHSPERYICYNWWTYIINTWSLELTLWLTLGIEILWVEQMYSDIYSSLWYHREYFHHPKISLCFTY